MSEGPLAEIFAAVGEKLPPLSLKVRGRDPVFPLGLRVGEAGAAAIGASALMAAELWRLQTGRPQSVRVDVDAAAAAMRGDQYLKRPQTEAEIAATPRSIRGSAGDIYRTADDRWVYLHRGFPHHRARIAAVLDGADDEATLTTAVSRWPAQALEDAVVAAGACAGMIRSHDEWLAHPAGSAIEILPLLEVLRIGDSAPEPLPEGDRPLSGVRTLDLTRVLAGPTCARTLAEHGAEVLRVGTDRLPNNTTQNIETGYGKRSCVLDLTTREGEVALRGLVRDAHVFSQGYRPDTIAGKGFGPEEVAAIRPGIVYVTLSAFSHEGPWRDRRGFDTLVQTVSGIAQEYALEGRPRLHPVSVLDYVTGYVAAFGVMVALSRRLHQGGSYLVRVSLAQTARWVKGLGRVPATLVAFAPQDLPPERIAALSTTTESEFGTLTHLAPIAQLNETPARWARPPVPLDHDRPEWLL